MFFFFASRRRHTSWPRDWSSDVCSSDLIPGRPIGHLGGSHPTRPTDGPSETPARLRAARRPDSCQRQIGRASCREREEVAGWARVGERGKEGAVEHQTERANEVMNTKID